MKRAILVMKATYCATKCTDKPIWKRKMPISPPHDHYARNGGKLEEKTL